jgi:mRNA (guanine-N7-)-methyltransferase
VQRLLKNVSSLLKPGGYFFGATPDSSTIWYKYQKAVEGAIKAGSLRVNGTLPRVRTDLYSISFEDDRLIVIQVSQLWVKVPAAFCG